MHNNYKLLIVDDDELTRTLVTRVAEALKFRFIREAADGVEALEQISETRQDIMVLDCSMPNMDGLQLLRTLKEQKLLKDMAVTLMTASNERKTVEEAVALGVLDYLVKPIGGGELKQRMELLIQRHNTRLMHRLMNDFES